MTTPHTPERLNLWDRFFNRHRREVLKHHCMERTNKSTGEKREYPYVDYRVIDRLTGSEIIERQWLGANPYEEGYYL